ncbi:MAG: formate dehydrogenase subunit delta [Bauldia sp.]|nr:formate dehydrogenase subunit delta [Bauldia sp.]
MQADKLVYMANQIGRFFVTEDRATAVDGIADHLRQFWDPRMRATIVAYLDDGGEGLDPAVREAVARLSGDAAPGRE